MRESEIIEFIKERISAHKQHLGIGDDCCVWQANGQQCLSSDAIIADVHFKKDDEPRLIGRKAAAAALSDLAAMGANAVGASLVYQCAEGWAHQEIIQGCIDELERHQCPLLGGDTVASATLGLSVTVWGEHGPAQRFVLRENGKIADVLIVTGSLGGSLKSGRHLKPEPRLMESQWLAQQDSVHAMMDLSDGLAADVPRMADASGCGSLILGNNVPIHEDVTQIGERLQAALCDGEDFELLCAVDAASWPQLKTEWPFQIPLTMIGMLNEEKGQHLLEDEFGKIRPLPKGFEH